MKWTKKMIRMLKSEYATCENPKELAEKIGVSYSGLIGKAKSLRVLRRKKDWTEQQDDLLKQKYSDTPMQELMNMFGKSRKKIYNRASFLGLRRSKDYLSEIGRANANRPNFVAKRFEKGAIPCNKGKHQKFKSKESAERCKSSQFKKGNIPHNTRPIGYERTYSDGYVRIKVENGKKMQLKHHYVWRKHYGEIPKGMCVAFRDGNRQNCDISNLMLITESEKMTRVINVLSPEQMRIRREKANSTMKERIRKDKMRIRWGLEPKTKLVKRWYSLNE